MKTATGMHQRRQISFVLKITMVVHSMYKSFPWQTQFPLFSPCTKASSRSLSWNPSQNLHFSVVFDLIQGVALTLSTMNLNLLQPRFMIAASTFGSQCTFSPEAFESRTVVLTLAYACKLEIAIP
jgi:hypothetical protein